MAIKQFNGNYILAEDRLMFRFNTDEGTEFRLWLTRFITLNLLQGIEQLTHLALERSHNKEVAQAVHEFQEEGVKQTANLNDPYQEANQLPLGTHPVLVTGLNLSEAENIFSIDFQLIGGQNLNIKLPTSTVQSMALLLSRLVDDGAKWRHLAPVVHSEIASSEAVVAEGKVKPSLH